MRNIRIYVLMVGTPLLGVALVLHLGQRMRALSSVGGAWTIEINSAPLSSSPCAELLTTIKQPALNISQSGMNLLLRLNNREQTTIQGQLRGTTLSTSELQTASACNGKNALSLTAQLTKVISGQPQLDGELRIAGCEECAPVVFKAFRQSSANVLF